MRRGTACVAGVMVLLLGVSGTQGLVVFPPCTGKYKDKALSSKELAQVLTTHSAWVQDVSSQKVKAGTPDERRVNLCRANLQEANLNGANLNGANLQEAYLAGANLQEARLLGANLQEAGLFGANLQEADLLEANLQEADLAGANLQEADLTGANLKNIREIHVIGTKGLSTIRFNDPAPLVALRKGLKESGLRNEERAITAALRKYALQGDSVGFAIEGLFLGGFLTDFGADPGRSFLTLIYLIPAFTLLYMRALVQRKNRKAGIWVTLVTDEEQRSCRVHPHSPNHKQVRRLLRFLHLDYGCVVRSVPWVLFALRVSRVGLYFSVVSAFHIGWREWNIGNWLTRLQFRPYTLNARGWVRMVSGSQSLISVYLLALWALTYFGRPFE